MTIPQVEIKAKEASGAHAVDLRLNGNKFTIPLQGGIFGVITAFVFKAWITFNQMQSDVTTALDSLDTMSEAVQSMDAKLGTAISASNKNTAELAKLVVEVDDLRDSAKLCEDRTERLCDANDGVCRK